jgi:hypothetical protein
VLIAGWTDRGSSWSEKRHAASFPRQIPVLCISVQTREYGRTPRCGKIFSTHAKARAHDVHTITSCCDCLSDHIICIVLRIFEPISLDLQARPSHLLLSNLFNFEAVLFCLSQGVAEDEPDSGVTGGTEGEKQKSKRKPSYQGEKLGHVGIMVLIREIYFASWKENRTRE